MAEVENPDCHLSWTTLAGIGMVESHHGTYRGAGDRPQRRCQPPIRGVELDGTNGNLEILDRDASTDDDPVYARAMGPMQFIPETWRLYGVDANNDRVVSPDNFDDAALSAAGYLCFRGKDLATPVGWMNALRVYKPFRPVRQVGAGLGHRVCGRASADRPGPGRPAECRPTGPLSI